jgi:hypothetical protein
VLELEPLAGAREGEGFVTGAVVGHDASDDDAEALVIGDGRLEEGRCASGFLIFQNLREGDARGVVDANVNELPADAAAVALTCAVAGNPMADPIEAAKLLDVDMDQLAWVLALVASHGLGRIKIAEAAQAGALQDPADGCRRDTGLLGDMLPAEAPTAQGDNLGHDFGRRRAMEALGPGGPVHQSRHAPSLEASDPFAYRSRADACGSCGSLRRLPAQQNRLTFFVLDCAQPN